MSKAEQGPRETDVRKEVASTYVGKIQDISRIAQTVEKSVLEGRSNPSSAEVLMALSLIRGLCDFNIIQLTEKGQGQVIFPDVKDKVEPQEPVAEGKGRRTKKERGQKPERVSRRGKKDEVGVGGFGALLRVKIGEVLPQDKSDFKREELTGFVSYIGPCRRVSENIDPEKQDFTREEAEDFLQKVLTTREKPGRETPYGRIELMQLFRISAAHLNELSMLAGHDWTKKETLSSQQAMQIRGLLFLERIEAERPKKE